MLPRFHPTADLVEPDHVLLLGRQKRVSSEVRQDLRHQVLQPSNLELQRLVGTIRPDRAAFPHLLEQREQLRPLRVLADRKTRPNLPSESVSPTRLERNAEAALAIHVPRDVGREIRSGYQGR